MTMKEVEIGPGPLSQEERDSLLNSRDGSKFQKLLDIYSQPHCNLEPKAAAIQLLVELHFKILYSAHKNKKSPSYLLKGILISLKGIEFDRQDPKIRARAKEITKLLKPSSYEFMIEIFDLSEETEFFNELTLQKLKEGKFRDVVFIWTIYPKMVEATNFIGWDEGDPISVRIFLMRKLIDDNDVTTARIMLEENVPQEQRRASPQEITDCKVFLAKHQYRVVKNHKKAAALIKELNLDCEVIREHFADIELRVLEDSINFFFMQFGVSFKHFSMENLLRLADYLTDKSP
mmetsp:Transcript_1928/g.2758  ORF Transcript_1928/g.2758 Transcript_1928/m.2758 type:complete len:290 (+) Transcript_1928:426-1295(+)